VSTARVPYNESNQIWTSGTDLDCPGNFFWCTREKSFAEKEVFWAAGQPDSSAGDCVHIIMDKKANHSLLFTADCNNQKHFVCEVRKAGRVSRTLVEECMELWDISGGAI
jgi:Lectin C-type domain